MKKTLIALFLACTMFLVANVKTTDKSITVYNGNFALVKSEIELDLKKGIGNYYWNNIPKTIQPSTLIYKGNKMQLLSQNYEYDLASTERILEKYIGKQISLILEDNSKISGKLVYTELYNANPYCSIVTENGLKILNIKEVKSIDLANLPSNFFLKPTLNLEINAFKTKKAKADISYLCQNISWYCEYNMVYNNNNKIELTPWVTLENNTGKGFENIELKLMAGEVKNVNQRRRRYNGMYESKTVMASRVAGGAVDNSFDEKSFADYHLYTLGRNISINNKQSKQMQLFEPKNVKAEKRFKASFSNEQVDITYKFNNSKKNGLGLPLPAGKTNFYKKDDDGVLEFIGSDHIKNSAKNTDIELTIGKAFDLKVENKVIKEDRNRKTKEITAKLSSKIINSSKKDVVVYFDLKKYYDFFIYKSNLDDYKKIKKGHYEFKVKIKAESDYTIKYTIKSK